jgi:AI-2 transport protein TqsA
MNPSENKVVKNTRMIAYFLGFITFVLIVYILTALQAILIPITIAIFLTFLFHPLLLYFYKYGAPKWVSIFLIFLVVSVLYYFIGWLIIDSLSALPQKAEVYSHTLSITVQEFLTSFDITLKEFAEILGINIYLLEPSQIFQSLLKSGVVQNIFAGITSTLGDFIIVMVFWVFMMAGKSKFEDRLRFAFSANKESLQASLDTIDNQLQSYIVIKTFISILTGLLTTIILIAYGIDFAIVWGILTFILNYIPNIGSILATIFPIIIALLQYGLGFTSISLSILLLVNQNIIGNFLEPHFTGRQMDLSPVFVLFSLIFWGYVWGIVGMFLAVPIAASMKILFANIEPLKPIAILMGSKSQSSIITDTSAGADEKKHVIVK